MKLRSCLLAGIILVLPTVQAATLVEITDTEGLTRIFRDGSKSRLEMSGESGYMVIDSAAQTVHAVVPEERMVMDMSDSLKNAPDAGPASSVKIKLNKQGSGPRISGYKTTRYSYSADGKDCGTLFTSQQALADTGINDMFAMMERLSAQADAMMSAFGQQDADPCERTGPGLTDMLKKIGAPLRILDSNGKTVSEVITIDKDAALPANAFAIPADYKVHNTDQMMRDTLQQIQKMPDMQELMKQMQQQ